MKGTRLAKSGFGILLLVGGGLLALSILAGVVKWLIIVGAAVGLIWAGWRMIKSKE